MPQDNQFFVDKQTQLLSFLVTKNILTKEQSDQATKEIKENNKTLDAIILEKNWQSPEEFTKSKSEFLNLLYADLSFSKVDEQVLNIIPSEVAENYKVVCFDRDETKLKVGLVEPDNFKAIEAIDFLAKKYNLRVEYFLISSNSFQIVFKQYKEFSKEISAALEIREKEEDKGDRYHVAQEQAASFDDIVKDAPVAKIISVIIKHAVESGASDIHIEPLPQETRVRYRIDGILHNFLVLPKNIATALVARIKVLANLKLDETRIPQDGRIRLNISNHEIDFRISVLPLMGEEKVVMRVLDSGRGLVKLESLGFDGNNLEVINNNTKKTGGMILVTGPTGSGKSTTLYAVLNMVNREEINIVTLEDPVEYFVKGVNQSQVRPEIEYTFATGLRSILRQDPDIIMVGEIRDNETAELAVHAALTGHLVLSTLHTKDAIGAIPRLLDMKIEPFLLASTLDIVEAQRLARRVCPDCKQEQKLPDAFLNEVKARMKAIPDKMIRRVLPNFDLNTVKFYKGAGCNHCNNTGYTSRIAIAEVISVNQAIKDAIIEKNGFLDVEEIMATQDFMTMEQDGLVKAAQGITSLEEVVRVIQN